MPNSKTKEFIIQSKFLRWFKKNQRILPWSTSVKNNLPNPYNVMISEFMLQQTKVNSVISKFNKFIQIWPNLNKLSAANENEILRFWYYISTIGISWLDWLPILRRRIKIISFSLYSNSHYVIMRCCYGE